MTTGRTGPPHGPCCRAPPCSLQKVRVAAPAGYVSHQVQEARVLFVAFHSSPCYFFLLYFCIVTCLHCYLSFLSPPLLSFLKSYYRSGSIPELLFTLLSNWKHSVKPRPAVSYVNCRPVQAAAVCPSFSLHVLLLPVLHSVIYSCFSCQGVFLCVCVKFD